MEHDLRYALNCLRIRDLDGLEAQFLKTEAFLRPWASFRDHFLLQDGNMQRASEDGAITRTQILYWYTLFDEGEKRYDPLADETASQYTLDEAKHGIVDKSWWGVAEFEKLLYVWLLQSFKVGKARNPQGFEYFVHLNVCTAWEEVFVPIVRAVRKDYNSRGRFHYGRLAKYIEHVSPSAFAFPNFNNGVLMAQAEAATAERGRRPATGDTDPISSVLVRRKDRKKVQDEEEMELQTLYAQYGQLIERPRFNIGVSEWVQEQRSRIHRKLALDDLADEETFAPHGQLDPKPKLGASSSKKRVTLGPYNKFIGADPGGSTKVKGAPTSSGPTKGQRSDDIHSAMSYRDSSSSMAGKGASRGGKVEKLDQLSDLAGNVGSLKLQASPQNPKHVAHHSRAKSTDSTRSASIPVITKPSPLEREFGRQSQDVTNTVARPCKPPHQRMPSYEGSGYFDINDLDTVHESEHAARAPHMRTRIPSPTEVHAKESTRQYHPLVEHAVSRAIAIPPVRETPPPLPTKSPMRGNSVRNQAQNSARFAAEASRTLGPRIVSKENIRSALGGLSRQNSEDSLKGNGSHQRVSSGDGHAFATLGGRGMNTGESPLPPLPTFNTHMFPRVGSPARGQTEAFRRHKRHDQYVMDSLQGKKGSGA